MYPELITPAGTMALVALGAYLLGSIPFGVVVTRALGLGNLRQIGSGNIGATNVLRTGNKTAALATLLLDGAKGAVAVLLTRVLVGTEDAAQLAALASFLGHLFPIWLGFKGGKGVATFLGTMLALAWPLGLACCLTWLASAFLTRISSASALIAAASALVWLWVFGLGSMFVLLLLLVILVFERHKANIARLLTGKEPKIGAK